MRRLAALLPCALLLAALFLLASCDLEFPEQEVWIRHDAAADRLDLLFIAKGLSADEPSDAQTVPKAVAVVERLLDGRREFMVIDWPMYVDFEEMVQGAREAESEAQAAGGAFPEDRRVALAEARHLLGVADLVQVTGTGLFQDAEGRLCGYQLVRVEPVSRFLGWLNGSISRGMLRLEEDGKLLREVEGDQETARRWLEKSQAGTPWVDLQDGAFVVDVPLSEELGSHGIVVMAEELLQGKENDRWLWLVMAEFLRHTQTVQLGPDGLRLTVGHSSGVTTLRPTHPDRSYDPALAQALAAKGIHPDPELTLEGVRKLLPGAGQKKLDAAR